MNEAAIHVYAERFEKVFDYIDQHFTESLDVEQFASVANCSKFHFHRQFSLYTGTGVSAYLRMVRLRHASYRLAFRKEDRIIDIALDSGFDSPESFSRAFKQAYGQPPSQFRKQPKWQPWNEQFRLPDRIRSGTMDVRIVDFEETQVAVLEHRGGHLNGSMIQ